MTEAPRRSGAPAARSVLFLLLAGALVPAGTGVSQASPGADRPFHAALVPGDANGIFHTGTIRSDGMVGFDPFAGDGSRQSQAYRETFVVPIGGDVDGDAKDDLLQVEVAFDGGWAPTETALVGLGGADGSELWRAELGAGVGWAGYLVGDATGDGHPDLGFTTLEDVVSHGSPLPPLIGCNDCSKWVETATTRLLLLDGASGAFRWQDRRDVVWAYQEHRLPTGWIRNEASGNGTGSLAVLSDVDGDGGRELVWAPWTWAWGKLYLGETVVEHTIQRAQAVALSGTTGRALWEVDLAGEGATYGHQDAPLLLGAWPGPDGSGDGLDDVYTSEIVETGAKTILTRRGIDGVTGEELWVQRRDWDSDGRLLHGSYVVLGDGGLVHRLAAGDLRSDVQRIDPATGGVSWQQLGSESLLVVPAGDVDGDAAADLLSLGYDPEAGTVTLDAVNGADGGTISRRLLDVAWMDWVFLQGPLVDHSGDGAADPLVFGGRKTPEDRVEEIVTITDLADGTELWGTTGGGDARTYWFPGGDLDGRGGADVLSVSLPDPRIEIRALRGSDGAELWGRPAYRTGPPGGTAWQVVLGFLGDVDGEPGDDLMLSSLNAYDEAAAILVPEVELLNGADGGSLLRLL